MNIVVKNRHPVPPQHIARARSLPPRLRSAETRIRIMEKLAMGLSVARIAQSEKLTVRRVRQIIADVLAKRETDPPAGFAQLQIARLNDAIMVAHSMMMNGDLGAMDRFIRLTGELDRYHGFKRDASGSAQPPETPRRLVAPERPLSLPRSDASDTVEEILPDASV